MSDMKRTLIRGTQWISRIGAQSLLGSMTKLRNVAGASTKKVIIPKGLDWELVDANGVPCEWIMPPAAPTDAVLLYLHGGGGVLGLYNISRKIIGHVVLVSNFKALCVDYPLAPEHPFPAALNDCVKAYKWLISEGISPKRIVILGDSMGGYLTLSTLLYLRDNGQPLPAAAVCISPVTDPTCSGESMTSNAKKDALLSPQFMRTVMEHYVQGYDLNDPYLSPLKAGLSGLPPILIQAGEDEILLDDSKRFSQLALAAGVDVHLDIWLGMWHDWHVSVPELKEANQAIEQIAKFIRMILQMKS